MSKTIENRLEEFGLWWSSKEDSDRIFIANNSRPNGFSRKEAEEILPQVEEACKKSERASKIQHILVSQRNTKYYVLIDSTGSVKLPRLKNGEYGKTLDKTQIPGFRIED
ncbi:MAG: hypothetical protein KJ559_00815, partial [Nanoarchaeota archaeon]|nr:hypothetical protein [Nanoarchaeota archaeon]